MKDSRSRLIVHSLEAHRMGDGLGDGLGAGVLRMLSRRGVLLSGPGDTVIVDLALDEAWVSYLGSIGFEIGRVLVAGGVGETLVARVMSDGGLMEELRGGDWVVEPYMGGEEIEGLVEAIGGELRGPGAELMDRLNLKSNLCPILGHVGGAGLPTIPTTLAGRDDVMSTAKHMLNEYGRVMVRSDLSIGGHGVWKVESTVDLEALGRGVERAGDGRLFVLQPLLPVTDSPNVQYVIGETGYEFLGVSAQQMTQSLAFGGNAYPCAAGDDPKIRQQGDAIAAWLLNAGYRGMVGIDFIVTTGGAVFVVEINPRVNTSTFPLLMSKRLGRSAFRLVTGIGMDGVSGFEEMVEVVGEDLLYETGHDGEFGAGLVPLMLPEEGRAVLDVMVFGDGLDAVDRVCSVLLERAMKGVVR